MLVHSRQPSVADSSERSELRDGVEYEETHVVAGEVVDETEPERLVRSRVNHSEFMRSWTTCFRPKQFEKKQLVNVGVSND